MFPNTKPVALEDGAENVTPAGEVDSLAISAPAVPAPAGSNPIDIASFADVVCVRIHNVVPIAVRDPWPFLKKIFLYSVSPTEPSSPLVSSQRLFNELSVNSTLLISPAISLAMVELLPPPEWNSFRSVLVIAKVVQNLLHA